MSAKRLLTLYSQQRIRFALELKREFGVHEQKPGVEEKFGDEDWDPSHDLEHENVFQECAESDQKSLEEYERALRAPIPRKAHFLIASQYALMQQVYSRITNLSLSYKPKNENPAMRLERSFV